MTDLSKGEIKIYEHNGSNQVEVIMQDNSIWLSAEKIGELFDNKDRSTIQRHIKHIYEEDELSKDSGAVLEVINRLQKGRPFLC